ncbi:MAG: hypothetical protein K8I60_11140 [Anaerolineae bacterium]|nr:hypothetical protein [Anaerolineae bacterium]
MSQSQKQFQELEAELNRIKGEQRYKVAGSFSAFQAWLTTEHPSFIQQARLIASDVRQWRDTQDVLRQVWERIYWR